MVPLNWRMISWKKKNNQTMDDLGVPIYHISNSALFKTNDSMVEAYSIYFGYHSIFGYPNKDDYQRKFRGRNFRVTDF